MPSLSEGSHLQPRPQSIPTGKVASNIAHNQQQEIMNLSNQLHQDILSKVDKEWDDNAINIQFIYDYKNQPQKIRSYNLSASAYEEFIQPYLKEVEERKNSFTNVIVNK